MPTADKLYTATAVRSLQVPYTKPQRTWAGHGSGGPCDLCGEPIDPQQIEYEVELSEDACVSVLNLHLSCFEVWMACDCAD